MTWAYKKDLRRMFIEIGVDPKKVDWVMKRASPHTLRWLHIYFKRNGHFQFMMGGVDER